MESTPAPAVPAGRRSVWVIVVAGGGGTRYGAPKQYEVLAGRRVIDHSVVAARSVADGVVVVVPGSDVATFSIPDHADVDAVVAGGATRADSVRNGLAAVPDTAEVVLVHDAARPAASPALFRRVVDAVRAGADGVVPAVAVVDSLRRRDGGAVDRDTLVAVQTPQGFLAAALRAAHVSGLDASDDATLVEGNGGTVRIVDGETTNTKLTHPHDRIALEAVLAARPASTTESTP